MIKILKRVVQVAAFLYLFMIAGLYFFQEGLIFNFAPVAADYQYSYSRPHEFLSLNKKDGATLHGVIFQHNPTRPSDQVVLYFKGNAGNIGRSEEMAAPYLEMGYDFISMDYRDFGKSRGEFTEAALLADALDWYNLAVSKYGQGNVKILAWSMGGAFAAHVAANTDAQDFIVFAPFKSVIDMGYRRYPFIKHEWFTRFPLRSDLRLAQVKDKSYVIYHGTEDKVVPHASGQALHRAANRQSIDFITIKGANHMDIPWRTEVLQDVKRRWQKGK